MQAIAAAPAPLTTSLTSRSERPVTSQRVDQPGGRDDRGAVLVVVEDGDVHGLAQLLLDDEAAGRLDVLEVDAAEGRPEQAHAVDELVDLLGVDLEVDRVDVGEALEQDRLALHDRLGAERAEVAEAEHRGAVRDHRHEVALGGVVVDLGGIGLDREAGRGHPRRIGERQVALGRERLGRRDLDLARPAAAVHLERLLVGDRDVVGLVLDGGAVVGVAHLIVPLTLPAASFAEVRAAPPTSRLRASLAPPARARQTKPCRAAPPVAASLTAAPAPPT